MSRIEIKTEKAPAAIGPYSQAILSKDILYLSGQIPMIAETNEIISDDIEMQIRQTFKNMQAICDSANAKLTNAVKLSIYLVDLKYFTLLNDIMLEFFNLPFPARSTIQVSALPKGVKIEIDAIVAIIF